MRRVDWSRVKDPQWACKQGICAHPACLAARAAKLERLARRNEAKATGRAVEGGQLMSEHFERTITAERGHEALSRLINSYFRQKPEARASIPANPDDDDLVASDYVSQLEAEMASLREQLAQAEEDKEWERAKAEAFEKAGVALKERLAQAARERAEVILGQREEITMDAAYQQALGDLKRRAESAEAQVQELVAALADEHTRAKRYQEWMEAAEAQVRELVEWRRSGLIDHQGDPVHRHRWGPVFGTKEACPECDWLEAHKGGVQ